MKKLTALFLALIMALSLVSCGTKPDASNVPDEPQQTSEPVEPFQQTATIEETVLYDENDVKITATSLSYNNYSVQLNLLIENNSNKDLSFVSGSIGYSQNSINQYMVQDGYLNCDVKAGMKANEDMSFDYSELMMYGITAVAEMEIAISITDADYNHIYTGPLPLRTSIADTYEVVADGYKKALSNTTLQDSLGYTVNCFDSTRTEIQSGVSVVSGAQCSNHDDKCHLLVEVENTTNQQVTLGISEIAVNGLLIESGTWTGRTINAGRNAVIDIDINLIKDSSILNAYGIKNIEQVDFVASPYNEQNNPIANVPVHFSLTDSPSAAQISGKEVYNAHNLRITSSGFVVDSDDDLNLLLAVENTGAIAVTVSDVFDSLSVNGYMSDYICYDESIPAGKACAFIIELDEDDLSDNGITAPEQIKNLTIDLEIHDGQYKEIDTPTLKLEF